MTAPTYGMSPSQFWRSAFGSPTWHPLAGDADGDGRADLLSIGHTGDSVIEMVRTSAFGKATNYGGAFPSSGKGLIAAVAGSFQRTPPKADVVMVFADGTIKVVWGMAPGTLKYQTCETVSEIPGALIPQGECRAVTADFDGDGKPDILLLSQTGQLLLLRNTRQPGGLPHFEALSVNSSLAGATLWAAGNFASDKRGRVVWIDVSGSVWASHITPNQTKVASLETPQLLLKVSPEDHIAVGRFQGNPGADIIAGQQLLRGGNPSDVVTLPDLPTTDVAKWDGEWGVADIDGNGKDDLIRHRESHDHFGNQDVLIHFSYDSSEPARGFYCSGNDGLPDLWKLGLMKPGGLDLKALGCKVGHRDVVVEIERFDNVDFRLLQDEMQHAADWFSKLPISNPDGTTGIALHFIFNPAWPLVDHDRVMQNFEAKFPPPAHRGITHMMFAEYNGPLNSEINGDHGHFNGHWREFLHEFGHQLDLVHDARFPSHSPGFKFDVGPAFFLTLMSYSYSYAIGGTDANLRYSDGALSSYVVDEEHMSEVVPIPFSRGQALGAGPYNYHVEPGPEGKTTLVDWDWNGVVGETDVMADINYSHGVDFGPQFKVARTQVAPALIAHGEGKEVRPLSAYSEGGAIVVRSWLGKNRATEGGKWSTEAADPSAGVTGDVVGVYLGKTDSWIAYPTGKGVVMRKVTLNGDGEPILGPASPIAKTEGAQPSLAIVDDRVVLFLWRSKSAQIGYRLMRKSQGGLAAEPERTLDLISEVPIGTTAGPITPEGPTVVIARMQPNGMENGARTEVVRCLLNGIDEFKPVYRSWLFGTFSHHRITVLWRPEKGNLPDGRTYILGGGTDPAGAESQQQWIEINFPYPYNGGWHLRRYRTPSFTSKSTPGACFYAGNIMLGFRSDSDDLNVSFYGTGAGPAPLGDFDELGHIRDYGLSHSLNRFNQ